jgi:hypothetical protein
MTFREARLEDIPQIQIVRNAVKENTLSDPNLVTEAIVKSSYSPEVRAGFVKSTIKLLALPLPTSKNRTSGHCSCIQPLKEKALAKNCTT